MIANLTTPKRPALRWHGGKWRLAPWVIAHFPPHRCYVEPFAGAASVLLRKERSYAEIYNDLDDDVVNLFTVLRSSLAADLMAALRLTPYSRTEYQDANAESTDPLERARRLVIRSFQGFGGDASKLGGAVGFRGSSSREGSIPAHDWAGYPDALQVIISRLRGVVIENRDAVTCVGAHDGPDTLHYVDPPYVHSTRSPKTSHRHHGYAHEMSDQDHVDLVEFLRLLSGMVVLSGYGSSIYDQALAGWRRIEKPAMADGARPRIEVLWINPLAANKLDEFRGATMFGPDDLPLQLRRK